MIGSADARTSRVSQTVDSAPASPLSDALDLIRGYITLTKPRVISLLLLTTLATMYVADPAGPKLSLILWTMLGGYLAAGGAGAINHYVDRDRDAHMARTSGLIQVGYLILALRTRGLQVGPLGGFDAAGVDADLFAESGWNSLLVLNVGWDVAEGGTHPRADRLDASDAVVTF